jgi:hypothetical protein
LRYRGCFVVMREEWERGGEEGRRAQNVNRTSVVVW